jgi:hypothetical protein
VIHVPKVIVIGDFGVPDDIQTGPVEITSRNLDDLFKVFQPVATLNEHLAIRFSSIADFAVESVCQQMDLAIDDKDRITAILHNSRFQEIESAWRGLAFLQEKRKEDGARLVAIHSTEAEVRQTFYDAVFLPQYNGKEATPATAVFFNFDFTHMKDSFEALQDLIKMGEAIRTPVVAGTTASFFGLKNLLHLSAMKEPIKRLTSSAYQSFHKFRESETAFWGCLTVNRFLQRLPHALDGYSEPCSPSKPETYLWGRAIWILAANLIESYNTKGHTIGLAGLGTGGEQHGMPTRTLPLNRKESVETPLEAPLDLDTMEALPYLGLSPIAQLPKELGGDRQPQMLYLHMAANLHRMPDPANEKIGLLTVHTNLAYSILIGRISNLATQFILASEPCSPEEMADKIQQHLLLNMWHKEASELTVVPESDGLLIEYKPYQVIHTRRFEVSLHIPLQV